MNERNKQHDFPSPLRGNILVDVVALTVDLGWPFFCLLELNS